MLKFLKNIFRPSELDLLKLELANKQMVINQNEFFLIDALAALTKEKLKHAYLQQRIQGLESRDTMVQPVREHEPDRSVGENSCIQTGTAEGWRVTGGEGNGFAPEVVTPTVKFSPIPPA